MVRAKSQSSSPAEVSPLRVVQAAIQAGRFDPVYYLHGEDEYLKDDSLAKLLHAAIDPSTRDFNCEFRRAAELDAEALSSLLQTPPMLAERRAVVIREIGALKKGPRAILDKYLARPASDTLLLLTSAAGSKADAAIVKQSTELAFSPLPPERVRRWIAHHAETALGVSVANDAAALLEQAVGNDLRLLAAELDKCVSYARGLGDSGVQGSSTDSALPGHGNEEPHELVIDVEAVSAVVGVRRGETVVDLLDAVARRDASRAASLVDHVLSQPKVTAVQVVMMLSTQAFALAWGRARRDAGIPTQRLPQEYFAFLKETGGYPGRPWGEAASAWTRNTEQWSRRQCEQALEFLLKADMALKETTVSNPSQILMSLVLSLCATGSAKRSAA